MPCNIFCHTITDFFITTDFVKEKTPAIISTPAMQGVADRLSTLADTNSKVNRKAMPSTFSMQEPWLRLMKKPDLDRNHKKFDNVDNQHHFLKK
jgi:hypothetical protein